MGEVSSVNKAVAALNAGTIACAEDVCVVYSASSQSYFSLYKVGSKDRVMQMFGINPGRLAASGAQAAGAALSIQVSASLCPSSVNLPSAEPDPRCRSVPHPSVSSQGPEPSLPLAAGAVVSIGGCTCQVTAPIGMGSFGAVWSARRQDGGGEVAIKEILCRSEQEIAHAGLESALLRKLSDLAATMATKPQDSTADHVANGGTGASRDDAFDRIPAMVASENELIGPELWRVRLAMTKVPGEPLDWFIDRWQQGLRQAVGAVQRRDQFVEACHFVKELISQLSPTFESISNFVYHRDVNSHNILVDGDARTPRFGLVDFGLAVDLSTWRGPLGPSSWQLVDIGGDCRYWPMAAWLQFECGYQELVKYAPLSTEYQTMLDLHALGITALQVLAAMAPFPSTAGQGPSGTLVKEILPDAVWVLLSAWTVYWKNVTRFWERLLEAFRSGGDQNALKASCIEEDVHNIVGKDLAVLRAALREADVACSRETGLHGAKPLFAALLELVSAGGTVGSTAEAAKPSSWRNVRALIDTDDFSSAGTGAPPDKMAPARVALLNSKGCGPSVISAETRTIVQTSHGVF